MQIKILNSHLLWNFMKLSQSLTSYVVANNLPSGVWDGCHQFVFPKLSGPIDNYPFASS